MKRTEYKYKVGVLGAGTVSKDMHLPVLVNIPGVSISWLCDKNMALARKLANLYRVPSVFSQIEQCTAVDIVLVAIPVGFRSSVMEYILNQGWHAFCEKPFALTLADHDRYLDTALANNVQLGVGLIRRYGPATLLARKMLQAGYFGNVIKVWASEGSRTKRTGKESGWYLTDTKSGGGGVLMETGSHLVDQLCTVLGVSDYSLWQCEQKRFAGLELETKFTGAVSTGQQENIPCMFEVSRMEDLCNGIFIQFSDFILKCGLFFHESLELISPKGEQIAGFNPAGGANTLSQALYLEWQDFFSQCESGKPSYISAVSARQSTAIIEQCYRDAAGTSE